MNPNTGRVEPFNSELLKKLCEPEPKPARAHAAGDEQLLAKRMVAWGEGEPIDDLNQLAIARALLKRISRELMRCDWSDGLAFEARRAEILKAIDAWKARR